MRDHGPMGYFVYMVRCEDDSYYTGIASDVVRRMAEHRSQTGKCAKYTRTHRVTELVGLWTAPDRSLASALEYRIKRLSHVEKEVLLADPCRADSLMPARGEGAVTFGCVDTVERARLWEASQS